MNKTKNLLLLFVMMAANIISVSAQKIDEGKVMYEISYPDTDMPDEQLAQMPTESTIYFKEDHSRMEMKMGMGMTIVMLFDNKGKTLTTLMDIMGNKTAVKMTEEDLKKQKEKKGKEDYQIKLTDETKEIAGIKCKKAVATGKDGSFDVYYTDQITFKKGDWADQDFKGIDGFLMQFKKTEGGITMQMTAKNVVKEKVDDAQFTVPADYKPMTAEEMQKMYGGGK
jgi:GLPGLI family protein